MAANSKVRLLMPLSTLSQFSLYTGRPGHVHAHADLSLIKHEQVNKTMDCAYAICEEDCTGADTHLQ